MQWSVTMKTIVAFEHTYHPSCPTVCQSDSGECGKESPQGRVEWLTACVLGLLEVKIWKCQDFTPTDTCMQIFLLLLCSSMLRSISHYVLIFLSNFSKYSDTKYCVTVFSEINPVKMVITFCYFQPLLSLSLSQIHKGERGGNSLLSATVFLFYFVFLFTSMGHQNQKSSDAHSRSELQHYSFNCISL